MSRDTVAELADEFKIAYPLTYDEIYQQGRTDAIKDIPKCKDCLHWKLLNVTQDHICDVFDWMSKEDDYCSFVEVKEQKNEETK